MTYLMYCGAPDMAQRLCKCLLGYALRSERNIRHSREAVLLNQWGKPGLRDHPDVYYSVSHCHGLACCIVAGAPVGIDAERVRAFSPHAARRACSEPEWKAIERAADPNRMFFRFWTLKESCVKAMGMGLAYPMQQIIFSVAGGSAVCLSHPDYRFRLWEDARGYVVAVCRHIGQRTA